MAAIEELDEDFRNLRNALQTLPESEEPPKSTLRVIGETHTEQAWNRWLTYFIDPDEPHGFDTELLDAFLTEVEQSTSVSIDYTHRDLAKCEVRNEVTTEGNDKRADIVLTVPDRWFLWIEMKVASSESSGQTRGYVDATTIGNKRKDEYPQQHYLYLSLDSRPDAAADEFGDLAWSRVAEALDRSLQFSRGQYPDRSVSQLDDFLTTVSEVSNMTTDEHQEILKEKTHLLAEYRDEFDEVLDAADDLRERTIETWTEDFLSEEFRPDAWNENWNCSPGEWGQIYRNTWRRDSDLHEIESYDSSDPIRLHFVHLIRNKDSFQRGKLTYQLRWPGESEYWQSFYELFNSDRWTDRLNQASSDVDIELWGNKFKFTNTIYSVDQSRLPESYFETLGTAFEDHLPIAEVITEILEEAIDDVKERRDSP